MSLQSTHYVRPTWYVVSESSSVAMTINHFTAVHGCCVSCAPCSHEVGDIISGAEETESAVDFLHSSSK